MTIYIVYTDAYTRVYRVLLGTTLHNILLYECSTQYIE